MRITPLIVILILISNRGIAQVIVDQLGDVGTVYIEQLGQHSSSMIMSGNGTIANVFQQGQSPNQLTIESIGTGNNISIEQRNTGSGNRVFDLRINGSGASVLVVQNSASAGNNGNGVGGGNSNGSDQSSMQITCPSVCPQGQYQYIRR